MRLVRALSLFLSAFALLLIGQAEAAVPSSQTGHASRVVILKVDGLNADLLYNTMQERDQVTGKSLLPWFSHVFADRGTIFRNFYVRGISLSAPSWSMLDTGQHTVIRGNVEYDRYTGQIYDYLNFFPFYIGYARHRAVDMPGVEVLDRAGIPLLIDRFQYPQVFQSFQLFQRGVRWVTLESALKRAFSKRAIINSLETAGSTSFDDALSRATENELAQKLKQPGILYLDFFIGDIDHEGHATSDPGAMLYELRKLDALIGRIWTEIEQGPLAGQTLLVVVSDHGMNNVPGVLSQTFSLPDLLNSPEGGAHHVITDREQLSDFKLKGINPLVHRVITPSTASFYLKGQASRYPTAWLDIDGNERAAVHLRNSDLNKIHILLLQLARPDLAPVIRRAAARDIEKTIERHRAAWTGMITQFEGELAALDQSIAARKKLVRALPRKPSREERASGEDRVDLRLRQVLRDWQTEETDYQAYLSHLKSLLAFHPDEARPFTGRVSELIPEMSLGDNNTVNDLEHYVVAPSPAGLIAGSDGELDEARSLQYLNYFSLLAHQQVRNNPQAALSPRPIDFTAMRLPDGHYAGSGPGEQHAYWLYGDDDSQLVVLQDSAGRLALRPVRDLVQNQAGQVKWSEQAWRAGLPLALFEDSQLQLPPDETRASWLCGWHTEQDWLAAIHQCHYSNGVIGITEELSPVAENVPGPPGVSPVLRHYEQRRRELVQPDFHVFAADHWNFNVRFPNPGGNHGSFLRISTHSVWMMAGARIPQQQIEQPYDTLSFASTILSLLGRTPPMPGRVVKVQ